MRLLANVERASAAETNESLRPAVEAGLIVPLTGLESVDVDALQSPLVYGRFAFRHDRVQQAAYATLPESERPALHLAIGLFVTEEATLGQAAQTAGLSQADFLRELGQRRIPIHYGREELEADLEAVEALTGR